MQRKLFTLFVFLTALPVFGFTPLESKWTINRTVHVYLDFPTFGILEDGRTFQQVAIAALTDWNPHMAHLVLMPRGPLPAAVQVDPPPPGTAQNPAIGSYDANNAAFFASSVYGDVFGANVLAVTLREFRDVPGTGSVMVETDVIFDNRKTWDSYRGPTRRNQNPAVEDFYRVAVHEFGHVIGLGHPDQAGQSVQAIMNSTVSNIDTLRADDINGATSLYANGPAFLNSNDGPVFRNLSTRGRVAPGDDAMIGGFIVQGSQPVTVVLRAIGGSLLAANLLNALLDPTIELRAGGGALIESNDDWIDQPNAVTIASYHLEPTNSRESAILRTLNPGSYTVIVRGFEPDVDTGNALVEIFDIHTAASRAANISTRGRVLTNNDILIGGFIVGSGGTKEVCFRAVGPSLTGAGVAGALQDPSLELRDVNGALMTSNDDWQQHASSARVTQVGLAPTSNKESAFAVILNPGSYTGVLRGTGNTTGIALFEAYDLSPSP